MIIPAQRHYTGWRFICGRVVQAGGAVIDQQEGTKSEASVGNWMLLFIVQYGAGKGCPAEPPPEDARLPSGSTAVRLWVESKCTFGRLYGRGLGYNSRQVL